jgi:predicted secreted protein
MRKRLFAVVLAVVLVSAAGSLLLAANKGAHHQGEVVGVDKDARTITIRIKVEGSDKKEIHVYNVTARTVFLDKDDSPTTFDAIKSGMKVRVKTVHKEKQRQILELEIRPDKK